MVQQCVNLIDAQMTEFGPMSHILLEHGAAMNSSSRRNPPSGLDVGDDLRRSIDGGSWHPHQAGGDDIPDFTFVQDNQTPTHRQTPI
jgi:hypothetical protein